MQNLRALGSWFRGRLEGRWQWIALIGILALFNIALDDENSEDGCYPFRIEPASVTLDVGEKERVLKVWSWEGTLAITHDCSWEVVNVASNNSTGLISISASPEGRRLTGKCTITATDTRKDGEIYRTSASIEVVRQTLHAYVVIPDRGWRDFGGKQTISLNEKMDIYVDGGVAPLEKIYMDRYGILEFTFINPDFRSFTVKALKVGTSTVYIHDHGNPEDILMVHFEVR